MNSPRSYEESSPICPAVLKRQQIEEAAPDLLDALRDLLRDEKLDDGDERLARSRAKAAAAIAKAEGKR